MLAVHQEVITRFPYTVMNDFIKSEVIGVINSVAKCKGSISQLSEIVDYSLTSKGKMKRAQLLYITNYCIEKEISEDLKYLAASIEIMHVASLVHDDIIDDAELRRGKPSVLQKYGLSNALLSGDYLIFTAIKILASSLADNACALKIIDKMLTTYCKMCDGQVLEEVLISNMDCSIKQYLKVISLKTATFFSLICEISGIISNMDEDTMNFLRKYGYYLGVAYQIRDDLLCYIDNKKHLDKSNSSDMERELITLPVLIAKENANNNQKEILYDFFSGKRNKDFKAVLKILHETDSINKTIKIINYYVKRAESNIDNIFDLSERESLKEYAEKLKA